MKLSASVVLLTFLVVSAVYLDSVAAKKKLRALLAGALLAAKPKFIPLPLPVSLPSFLDDLVVFIMILIVLFSSDPHSNSD